MKTINLLDLNIKPIIHLVDLLALLAALAVPLKGSLHV